jgi:hypothetical protein
VRGVEPPLPKNEEAELAAFRKSYNAKSSQDEPRSPEQQKALDKLLATGELPENAGTGGLKFITKEESDANFSAKMKEFSR